VKVRNAFVAFAGLPAVLSSTRRRARSPRTSSPRTATSASTRRRQRPPGEGVPYYWGMRANWGIDGFSCRAPTSPETEEAEAGAGVLQRGRGQHAVHQRGQVAARRGRRRKSSTWCWPRPARTDYSNEISAIRASGDFDGISLASTATTSAYFLKQYQTSGDRQARHHLGRLLAPVAKIRRPQRLRERLPGRHRRVLGQQPRNPWAQVFVRTYQATFGTDGVPALGLTLRRAARAGNTRRSRQRAS